MKTVLISHFYNEEFLLPHWVQHHVKMFDHGVMVDYASTDRSVEIIKQLAPHWEIRPSRNTMFDAPLVDQEVIEIEAEFDGCWKTILNTTEFLVMPELDLKRVIGAVLEKCPDMPAIQAHGMKMIDHKKDMDTPVDNKVPLLFQRRWGQDEIPGYGPGRARHRILHCKSHGHYTLGRHTSHMLPMINLPNELYCVWFGWSPYFHVKHRKMQIQTKIPADHFRRGWGVEHEKPNIEAMDADFLSWSRQAYNLYKQEPAFERVVESCRGKYPDPYVAFWG